MNEERSCTCHKFEKQKGKENNRCSIFSAIFISQRNVLESTNNRQKIDHYCFQILTWPSSSERRRKRKLPCICVYETDLVPSLHWLGLTRFPPSIHPRVRTHEPITVHAPVGDVGDINTQLVIATQGQIMQTMNSRCSRCSR